MSATKDDLILVCSCSYLDHAIRFSSWPDEADAYVDVTLNVERQWWQRVRTAWRYVFGNVCAFGTVAEVILHREDYPRLRAWLDARETAVAEAGKRGGGEL